MLHPYKKLKNNLLLSVQQFLLFPNNFNYKNLFQQYLKKNKHLEQAICKLSHKIYNNLCYSNQIQDLTNNFL